VQFAARTSKDRANEAKAASRSNVFHLVIIIDISGREPISPGREPIPPGREPIPPGRELEIRGLFYRTPFKNSRRIRQES
jgi:hypothetical protein